MHRVSTRSKSYTFSTTVRSSTCLLTIHYIRGNSQDRQGRFRILINRQFLQFLIEVVNQVYSQVVYTVIIITEAREFTFNIEAFCQADIITLSSNLRIFNSRKRIDSNLCATGVVFHVQNLRKTFHHRGLGFRHLMPVVSTSFQQVSLFPYERSVILSRSDLRSSVTVRSSWIIFWTFL